MSRNFGSYQSTLRYIPEERRSQFYTRRSYKHHRYDGALYPEPKNSTAAANVSVQEYTGIHTSTAVPGDSSRSDRLYHFY